MASWIKGIDGNTVVLKPGDNYRTERKTLGHISAVAAKTGLKVVYVQQPGKAYVEVYAPDNLMPYIVVNEDRGMLSVSLRQNCVIRGKHKTEIRVFAPEVVGFKASSSGDLYLAKGLSTQKNVQFRASSGGDIVSESPVNCGDIDFRASSSGDVSLDRLTCTDMEVGVSSSGDVEIEDVTCASCTASASSSGDCKIGKMVCSGSIECKGSSSGDVKMGYVDCQSVTADVSSSGGAEFEEGTASKAHFIASSAGQVKAKNLQADHVKAHASSGGTVSCYAKETVSMQKSSGGSIHCDGRPRQID